MILLKIIRNKIKEIKNSYNKLKIDKLKFICFKKRIKSLNFIKKINKPTIYFENKYFSPVLGKYIKKNIYYFFIKLKKKKFFSILTDIKYFGGHNIFLNIFNKYNKKLIKKDFIIDRYQLYENINNNIFLLIYMCLKKKIKRIIKFLNFFKCEYLLELKSKKEINSFFKKKNIKKNLIGINNRNLENFNISQRNIEIIINKYKNIISESGIKNLNYIYKYYNRGIKSFLVGENIFKNFYYVN